MAEFDVPGAVDLQWPLRSITKSYTVTLVLQLIDAFTHDPEIGMSVVSFTNASDTPNKDHPADLTFRAFAAVLADAGPWTLSG